jgi:glycosyltransferase involved in cell wall biosynthesis
MTPQRKKILFVLPNLEGGGLERVAVTLLEHLSRSCFEPHLALLAAVGPFLKEVPKDVRIHDLGVARVRYCIPGMIRLVWRLRPDVVLSAARELNVATGFVRPWLPRRLVLLVQEQTSVTEELAEKGSHLEAWKWLYRSYLRADKIICVADYILNDLADHFGLPRNKLLRIYNPVAVEAIRQRAEAANPYTGSGPHVLAAGRLSKVKGFDLLLEAMALVRKRVPGAQLTILGEGPLDSELKAQRGRLGLTDAVCFAGFQSNPYPYFKHADLFVLSSRYEGMPLVLLEALALGTFVVATDCPGGVREVLARSAVGELVPTRDAQLLAEAIIKGCERPRKDPGAEAREAVLDEFRIERVMAIYEGLFSQLTSPR